MNPFPLQETQPLLPRDNSYQQTSTSASSRVEHEIIVDTNDDDIHYIPSNQSSLLSWFMPQFVSKDRLKSSILLVVTMMSMILLLGVSMSPSQIASEGSAEILHSSPQLKLSIHKEFVSQAVHKFKVFRTGDRSGQVIAQGVYEHSVTSWNQLDAQVTDVFSTVKDRDEMFDLYFQSMEAVGYLEGYVTCLDINHYYVNFYSGLFDGGDPTPETVNFLEENYEWMVNMAEREWKYSSYWLNVKALVAQLNGLVHGLQSGCPGSEPNLLPAYLPSLHKNPSLIHMLLLNANGDLYQIAAKFDQPDAGPSMADDDVYSYGYTPDFPDNFTAPIDLLSSSPYAAAEETNSKSDNYMHPSLQKLYYAQDLLRQAQQKKTKNGHIKKATSTTSASKRDLSSTKQASSKSEKKRDASKAKVSKETERKFSARPNRPGSHCSVLIKLTHDYSDLLYGHDTWDDFQCMGPRIFKRYYMPVLTYAGDNGTVPQPDMQVNGVSRSRVITQPEVSGVTVNQAAGGAVTQDFIDNKANEAIITVGQTKRAAVEHAASGSTSSSDGHSHSHTQSMDKKKDQKLPRVDITYMDMRFSSSPAYLTSMDDFFVLAGRANLAVMETSEDMIDETILEQITPGTLLSWARTRMANQLAVNGPHWADVFAVRHSGTYTNQWMVLDLDRFTPGKKPQPNSGLLTVLEELPGYIHWEDLTHILADSSYWASFNNAYYKDVRALSGANTACAQDPSFCYDTDPRFVLFRQLEGNVDDIAGLQKILGYNRFQTDLASLNDSCATIACRSDLQPQPENQYPFGATDSKVSSARHSASRLVNKPYNPSVYSTKATYTPKIWARYGPTHDDVPVFCWTKFDDRKNVRNRRFSHLGQPECFDNPWAVMPNPGDLESRH